MYANEGFDEFEMELCSCHDEVYCILGKKFIYEYDILLMLQTHHL